MVLSRLKSLLTKHPIITNSLIYGSLYTGAEFSQQFVTRKILVAPGEEKPFDKDALKRYAVVGCIINANWLYAWYKWLDRCYVGTAPVVIAKKLFLDQFVNTPPLYVAFYTSMSVMEGKSDIFQECREKFVKTFLSSCIFWLPAQVVNFVFIPPAGRVIYMGFCSFAWVNILCLIKRGNIEDEVSKKEITDVKN